MTAIMRTITKTFAATAPYKGSTATLIIPTKRAAKTVPDTPYRQNYNHERIHDKISSHCRIDVIDRR